MSRDPYHQLLLAEEYQQRFREEAILAHQLKTELSGQAMVLDYVRRAPAVAWHFLSRSRRKQSHPALQESLDILAEGLGTK